jgi:hypothetical protein
MYEFHTCKLKLQNDRCISADVIVIILRTHLLPTDMKQVLSEFAARPQVLVILLKFTLEQVTKAQRGSRNIRLLFL